MADQKSIVNSKTFRLTTRQLTWIALYWAVIMPPVVLIGSIPLWISVPIVLTGIIGVIGILLAVVIRVPSDDLLRFALYAGGLGLAFAIIGGLAMNWLLPYVSIVHPLATVPLLAFFDVSIVVLALFISACRKSSAIVISYIPANTLSLCLGGIAPIFALASWLGAERLNNGHAGILTISMIIAMALYVAIMVYYHNRIRQWVYSIALYSISLALLLMYSLRSGHIIGWDINQEYEVFQTTLQHLAWHASYYAGLDYNACLSITILPTMFAQLTRVPAEYIFKVVFQLLFALSPVMVFAFAKRYLHSMLAFLAAFLFLSQTWFFEQMPGLIRQETAFIFFMLLLLALFDRALKNKTKMLLSLIALVGIILSHYSTAYVTIILLAVVLVLSYMLRWFRPFKGQSLIVKPWIIFATLAILVVWQLPITHTIGKITNFVTNNNTTVTVPTPSDNSPSTVPTAINIPPAPPAYHHQSPAQLWQNIVSMVFFIPNQTSNTQIVLQAQQRAVTIYSVQPGYVFYPETITDASASVVPMSQKIALPEKIPHYASLIVVIAGKIIKLVAVDILPLIGIAAMYREFRRTKTDESYRLFILAIGGFVLIATMVIVLYIQEYYNLTRLFLQMFLFLSTFAITGASVLLKRIQATERWIAGGVIILFLFSTGIAGQLTGGPARLTLNQPPSTMDTLYIHDTEVAAAQWIKTSRNYADPVEADAEANLRLESFADMSSANTALFPQTIDPQGYVYLSNSNITTGIASYEYHNTLLTFSYPLDFIQQHKNLIYNNGGSAIYH
jgi:uncharacterized membrane protein